MAIDTISGKATAGPGRDLALPAHLQARDALSAHV
jgi:hypothetical protein